MFQRAFAFARKHQVRHVWIDQECIDQEDPADIERHLNLMGRLYRESRYTVGVLSNLIYTSVRACVLMALTRSESGDFDELRNTLGQHN